MFTKRPFLKNDFLLEYKGELISYEEGCHREDTYSPDVGNFLFFFKNGCKSLWYSSHSFYFIFSFYKHL